MAFQVFQGIAQPILAATSSLAGIAGTIVGWVTAPILAGLTILIIWHGFNIIRGAGGQHHFLDIFAKSLRAFLVFTLALASGAYAANVVGFVNDLQSNLMTLVSGSFTSVDIASLGSYQVIDQAMDKSSQAANTAIQWGLNNVSIISFDVTGLVAIVCAALMMGCMMIYGFVACAEMLLIDFALAIIFGLGPLFVACLAFQSTSRFFDAWLGGVLKYVFTAVVIAAVIGLGTGLMTTYAASLQANASTMDYIMASFSALGACGVLIGIAIRAPAIAGDIVGGVGINALGPAIARGPLGAISSMTQKSVQGGANAAAYGAGKIGSSGAVQQLATSSLGQKAIQATQGVRSMGSNAVSGMRNFGNAISGKGAASGSVGSTVPNAYRIGTGGSGLGSISGGAASSVGRSPLDTMLSKNVRPAGTPFPKLNS